MYKPSIGSRIVFLGLFLLLCQLAKTQNLPDSCKLNMGTNLGGISDYGTELPFVNLMHNCREWYTKDVGNPDVKFNSEMAKFLKYRSDGYPTHVPQTISESTFPQKIVTIWAITDGWEPGTYTILFDGVGTLSFWGGYSNLKQINSNKIVFDMKNPLGSILEMSIDKSSEADPVRNIRVLMPGSESTYLTNPFNPVWINKLKIFKSVRFMDWGSTNNWGQSDSWDWDYTKLFDWSERQQLSHYTWANSKGIPYEMMIRLMNDYQLEGWVCVPHRASNDYIRNMAKLFHDTLNPNRKLTVEYSNEIWNWMFGQTQWLNKYGCVNKGVSWPEGLVPYIQNCLDLWTTEYGQDISRIKRTVGLQTGWADVSRRMALKMRKGSIDAVSPTFYFGLGETADKALDVLGANAKVSDIAGWARKTREKDEKAWIREIKTTIADVLKLPMLFYEGGQHLTPTPFGEEPTYKQALIDIQRDTAMYNLYNEWFTFLRTLQVGSNPIQLMNFSFVGQRSARYGSWGILETMNQDITKIPAPKYQAVLKQIHNGCFTVTSLDQKRGLTDIDIFPNPSCGELNIRSNSSDIITEIQLFDQSGAELECRQVQQGFDRINLGKFSPGIYILKIKLDNGTVNTYKIVRN